MAIGAAKKMVFICLLCGVLGGVICPGALAASETPSPGTLEELPPSLLGTLEDLSFDPPVLWVIMDQKNVLRIPWTSGKTLFLDFKENGEKEEVPPKEFSKKHRHHYVEVVLTRKGGSAVRVEYVPD